ncbi:AAA-like domain-containing protein [Iningainema tapete]|uniref:AAA-like domain-containing protein n=1 Tax=Iningainema tapete BLCC-T55 TaxID=2748662 RepID=A0A8J6XKC2_9CYAN|nr:AAA-like domain-containing protein [Iningainema tapete]MBD2777759.1 AAA-like domain-containing protein [Iningainema tapete BLCC-T55]
MNLSKSRRKRGVVLTASGLKRLLSAIVAQEMAQNNGKSFTLDELGLRINVSTKTLSRLWSLKIGVDQKTVRLCFSAFNLELRSEDYTILNEHNNTDSDCDRALDTQRVNSSGSKFVDEQRHQLEHLWSYPDGPVPLDSPFYVERPPIEELVCREVLQPGCLIRIKAPRQMGKSSLVLRLCAFAQKQGYRIVNLNCYQIDSNCLTDLNQLLRCLCWRVAKELGIDSNLNDYWDEEMGCKLNCTFYVQSHLLQQSQSPVVLVLNEVDRLFEYPHIASEFFALLRSWYEQARYDATWQKLRLVLVYSTEEYVTLNINRSPFNIGLPIRLCEFTQEQVEDLAQRHGLDWISGKESVQLMSLVGGHPYLIRMALYYLGCLDITLPQLLQEAIADGGIYRDHLWRYWLKLQDQPNLAKAYAEVVAAQSVSLHPIEAYQLDSLGLIRTLASRPLPRCELYRLYFGKQLTTLV